MPNLRLITTARGAQIPRSPLHHLPYIVKLISDVELDTCAVLGPDHQQI
jgi:hypothetical protein